jgi:hypothetical protein
VLWGANGLIVLAIFWFVVDVLAAAMIIDLPDPPTPVRTVVPPSAVDAADAKRPNPVTSIGIHADGDSLSRDVKFLARFGVDGREPAYLLVVARGLYVNAYRGEPIRTYSGDPIPELQGWMLDAFTDDGARFTNGQRTVVLARS